MAATKKAMAAKAAREYNPQAVIAKQEKQIKEMAALIQTLTRKLDEKSENIETHYSVISKLIEWFKQFSKRKTVHILTLQPELEDFGTIVGAVSVAEANNCFIIVDITQELIEKKQVALIMKEKTLPLPVAID